MRLLLSGGKSIADSTEIAARDQRIAEKQRRADDTEIQDGRAMGAHAARERHQRQRSAFAVIVGAQQHVRKHGSAGTNRDPENEVRGFSGHHPHALVLRGAIKIRSAPR